jgi:hypothetical protein
VVDAAKRSEGAAMAASKRGKNTRFIGQLLIEKSRLSDS